MNMVSVPPGHPRNIYDNKTLQDGKAMCTSVTLWVMMMALPLFTSTSPITTKFNRKVGHFHCHYFTGDNEVTTTRSYGFISPSINIVITKLGRVTCYHAPVLASS